MGFMKLEINVDVIYGQSLKAAMSLFYVKGQIRNTMVFPYYVLFVECASEWPKVQFYTQPKAE